MKQVVLDCGGSSMRMALCKPMGMVVAAAAFLAFGLNAPLVQAAPRYPTPPASYLRYKVYTINQLVRQVQSDPWVRSAYARTFHIPEADVIDYMKRNVVESYIPVTKTYTVYCVSNTGRIYTIRQVFKAGTKVFALRNGQPVIKWVCGNPLMSHLPKVETKTVKLPPKVITKVSPSAETLIPNQPPVMLIPSESMAMLPTAPVITSSASGITTIVGPGGFPLWLPLLPLAFAHGSSSSSTTGGSTTTSTTTGVTTTTGLTTTTTGVSTTTTTTGVTTTTNTTGVTTTTTTGVLTTSTSTTGTTTPEPSSSTSIGVGLVPLAIALVLGFQTTRRKRKADADR